MSKYKKNQWIRMYSGYYDFYYKIDKEPNGESNRYGLETEDGYRYYEEEDLYPVSTEKIKELELNSKDFLLVSK